LVLTACAGVLAFLALRENATRRELEATRHELERLRSDVGQSAGALPAGAQASLSNARRLIAHPPPDSAGPTDPAPARPAAERPLPTLEEVQETVLTAYGKEATDPNWRNDAERTLRASIEGGLPERSKLLSIECRTTMCLVEVAHATAEAAHSWMIGGFKGWAGSVLVAGEEEESGGVQQTLVAVRQGVVPPYAGM
jgi:hypothetical protein